MAAGRPQGGGAEKGHPYSLDLPVATKIAQMARGGMPAYEISKALGFGKNQVYVWLHTGEADFEAGNETIHSQLYLAYEKAEAEFVQSCIALWQTHFKDDWRSIMAFMARRWPKTWGTVAEAMQNGGNEGVEAIKVALKQEEYDAI